MNVDTVCYESLTSVFLRCILFVTSQNTWLGLTPKETQKGRDVFCLKFFLLILDFFRCIPKVRSARRLHHRAATMETWTDGFLLEAKSFEQNSQFFKRTQRPWHYAPSILPKEIFRTGPPQKSLKFMKV